jgi:hypothetical protein
MRASEIEKDILYERFDLTLEKYKPKSALSTVTPITFRFISFEQAVTVSEGELAVKQGLKTQEKRKFPCNAKVQAILQRIQSEESKPTDLLFPSPEGKYIDFHNFRNRAWKTILTALKGI